MDAFVKEFFIKTATTYMWTGQAVENFYNPRSRWRNSPTLRVSLHCCGYDICTFADSFDWDRSPQGREYWRTMGEE